MTAIHRIREYETIYVMRPDISDVDADKITDRTRTVIRNYDGKILEVNNWGKRRLAYEISKHQKGIYVYWRYAGNTAAVAELERNLRLLEPVLRFLTVRLEDLVDIDALTDIGDSEIPMRAVETPAPPPVAAPPPVTPPTPVAPPTPVTPAASPPEAAVAQEADDAAESA